MLVEELTIGKMGDKRQFVQATRVGEGCDSKGYSGNSSKQLKFDRFEIP